ncbi:hypothetical protein [Agrobacterium sp. a22-2]|uniref:hypothetical protein n=1 Tax=Agrobacterium sp. a22-2 TaxID=2283840 RepID=UPI001AED8462|nr:hypothetical protein [Agrobacterium sp. a22-2]
MPIIEAKRINSEKAVEKQAENVELVTALIKKRTFASALDSDFNRAEQSRQGLT